MARARVPLMGVRGSLATLEDGTVAAAWTSFVTESMRIVTRSDVDMSAPGRPKRELLLSEGRRAAPGC